MGGGVWPACDAGNTFANDCTYGDATGITHSDCDARFYVYRNAYTNANRNRRAAHGDIGRDVHGDI